jgi:hypothetical protein
MTTVSIGLVHIAQTPTTLEASLRAADMACYMAKEKGRNRVQVYHATTPNCLCASAKWPGCSACTWLWKKTAFAFTPRKSRHWALPTPAAGTSKYSAPA